MNFSEPNINISTAPRDMLYQQPFADWIVTFFDAQEREHASFVFKLLASQSFSCFLGWLNYDFSLGQNIAGGKRFLQRCAIDLRECTESLGGLDSARKIFERKIRYWQCRPMSEMAAEIVCPADSRVLFGSLRESSSLFLKSKFFDYEELLGLEESRWLKAFDDGDFMICRLTP